MASSRDVGVGRILVEPPGRNPPAPAPAAACVPTPAAQADPVPRPTLYVWRTKWRYTWAHPREWQSRIVLTIGDSLSDVKAQWPKPDDIVLFEPMCLGIADMPTPRGE